HDPLEGCRLQRILLAGLTAAGIALAGTSGAPAAPVNASVISDLATERVTPIRWGHWRYYHRRWGGYGYHPWRRRGRRRWEAAGPQCTNAEIRRNLRPP